MPGWFSWEGRPALCAVRQGAPVCSTSQRASHRHGWASRAQENPASKTQETNSGGGGWAGRRKLKCSWVGGRALLEMDMPAVLQTAVNTTSGSGAACESLCLGSCIACARVITSSSACFQHRTLPPSPKGKKSCNPGSSPRASWISQMFLLSGEGAETGRGAGGGSCMGE